MTIQRPLFHNHEIHGLSRPDGAMRGSFATKSYPERIADLLARARAPAAPPLRRRPVAEDPPMSEATRAKLIFTHTIQATFGGPRNSSVH